MKYRTYTLQELEREAFNTNNELAREILRRLSDDFDNEVHLQYKPKTKYKGETE